MLLLYLFVYVAITSDKLAIPAFLFAVYIIYILSKAIIAFLDEEIFWIDGEYLKKYTNPVLFWKESTPLKIVDIAGFVESPINDSELIYFDIKALQVNGVPVNVLNRLKSEEANKCVRRLNAYIWDLNSKKDSRIVEQYYSNNTHKHYPDISTVDELYNRIKNLSDELTTVNGNAVKQEIKELNLMYYLKKNQSITRYVLTKFTANDKLHLYNVYSLISKSFKSWEEFILTEFDRLFDTANESGESTLLETLEVFFIIKGYWQGKRFSYHIKLKLEKQLLSPFDNVKTEADRMLNSLLITTKRT